MMTLANTVAPRQNIASGIETADDDEFECSHNGYHMVMIQEKSPTSL